MNVRYFLAILFLLVFLAYLPQLVGVASIHWDAVEVFAANLKFASDELQSGRWPLWTPFIGAGFPFFADPQVALWYPINFLIAFFTKAGPWWVSVQLAIHTFLAGLGMYFLGRRLFRDPRAAAFVGLVYPFTGFFVGYASHVGQQNTAAILPWAILALDRFLERANAGRAALLGIAGALLLLIGHFQQTLYAAVFLLAWLIWRWSGDRPHSAGGREIVPFLGWLGVAVIIAVLLSAVQVIPTAQLVFQSARADWNIGKMSFNPLEPQSLLSLFMPNAQSALRGPYWGIWDVTQNIFYIGMLPLLLALVALFKLRGIPKGFFGGTIAVAFLYSLGVGGFLFSLISLLPLFDKMRSAIHATLYLTVGLVLLAGYGLERLLAGEVREVISRRGRTIILFLLVTLVAVSAVTLMVAKTVLPDTANMQALVRASAMWLNSIIIAGILFYLADWLIRRAAEQPSRRAVTLLFVFTVVELLGMTVPSKTFAAWRKPDEIFTQPAWLERLEASRSPEGADRTWGLIPLAWNHAQVLRYPTFDLYNPLELQAYRTYRFRIQEAPQAERDELLRKVGVRWAPCEKEPAEPCELKGALPHLGFLGKGSVQVTDDRPGKIVARVTSLHDDTLVFREMFYPGWQAFIDEQSTPIVRVDDLFQSIVVPAGDHLITWQFKPFIWKYLK